jgi:hypothetical protein
MNAQLKVSAALPRVRVPDAHWTAGWAGPRDADNYFFLFVIYFLYFRSVLLSIVYFISSCHLFLYNTIQTSMPLAGSEPAAPASDRLQILALASAATGIRTRNSSKRASPDLRLTPRGHGSRVPHCPGLNIVNVPTTLCWLLYFLRWFVLNVCESSSRANALQYGSRILLGLWWLFTAGTKICWCKSIHNTYTKSYVSFLHFNKHSLCRKDVWWALFEERQVQCERRVALGYGWLDRRQRIFSTLLAGSRKTKSHLFFYLFIRVYIYPYKLGNPLDVEQVIVRNTYTHRNKITAIKWLQWMLNYNSYRKRPYLKYLHFYTNRKL